MQQMTRGGNTAVATGIIRPSVSFTTGEADVSAYVLDANGKVRGDADMIFFNQPGSPDGSVTLSGRDFAINLSKVAPAVDRIAICAVPEKGDVGDLGGLSIVAPDAFAFHLDTAGMTEAAIIIGEFYRRGVEWKFRAVAQGFNGGLGPLSRHFGVDVAEEPGAGAEPEQQQNAPVPKEPAQQPVVSLKKVTLEKAGKVSLRKGGGAIRALLSWKGRGHDGDGDLDLYCFYVLKDGTCGKVYWKDMGRQTEAPWITLSGDSQNAGEEELTIHRPEQLKYALFATYSAVGNGTGSFKSYRPKLVLTDQDGSEVTIPLLNPVSTSYWVAISHIAVGDAISIEHVETYGDTGSERSPRLMSDGSWDVSRGPIEFKTS